MRSGRSVWSSRASGLMGEHLKRQEDVCSVCRRCRGAAYRKDMVPSSLNHLVATPPHKAEDSNTQANSQQRWADQAADSQHCEIGRPRFHSIRQHKTAAAPKTIIINGTKSENAPKTAKKSVTRKPTEANDKRSRNVSITRPLAGMASSENRIWG